VQPNGAAALLFSRQEAHAILRPKSGRVRARCELVGRSQLWPEQPTFKRKTGRPESGQKPKSWHLKVTSALVRTADMVQPIGKEEECLYYRAFNSETARHAGANHPPIA